MVQLLGILAANSPKSSIDNYNEVALRVRITMLSENMELIKRE
jgi:hypothetical protein